MSFLSSGMSYAAVVGTQNNGTAGSKGPNSSGGSGAVPCQSITDSEILEVSLKDAIDLDPSDDEGPINDQPSNEEEEDTVTVSKRNSSKKHGRIPKFRYRQFKQDEWTQLRLATSRIYDVLESSQNSGVMVPSMFPIGGTMMFSNSSVKPLVPDKTMYNPLGVTMIPWDGGQELEADVKQLELETGINSRLYLKEQKDPSICAICDKPTHSKCQGCMAVGYCSRAHQKMDWKDHRPFCVLYEMVSDPDNPDRKMLVAKTNIKKGEVILIEEPYFVSPSSDNEYINTLSFKPISKENQGMPSGKYSVEDYKRLIYPFITVCLGCNIYIDENKMVPCRSCGWPICNLGCKQLERHQQLECTFFRDRKLDFNTCATLAIMPPRFFGILRGVLLLKRDPEKWNTIFDEVWKKQWDKIASESVFYRCTLEYFYITLKEIFRMEDVTYKDVFNATGLIVSRGVFGSYKSPVAGSEKSGQMYGIYHDASLIRHKTIGNVLTLQTFPPALQIIATTPIKKGEPLYRDMERQIQLIEEYSCESFASYLRSLPCDCGRCATLSATEKELTAIVCLKCKRRKQESYLVIEEPAHMNSNWKCMKCGATKPIPQVIGLVSDTMREFVSDMDTISDSCILDQMWREMLEKCKGQTYHPNHCLIMAVEWGLVYRMMAMDRMEYHPIEDIEYLMELLSNKIKATQKYHSEWHNSIVALKMRLALVITQHAGKMPIARITDLEYDRKKLEQMHDEICDMLNGFTRANVLQIYVLKMLRQLRKLMGLVAETHENYLHIFSVIQNNTEIYNANLNGIHTTENEIGNDPSSGIQSQLKLLRLAEENRFSDADDDN